MRVRRKLLVCSKKDKQMEWPNMRKWPTITRIIGVAGAYAPVFREES